MENKYKTISVQKLYSILKDSLEYKKNSHNIYLLSFGNFKEEDYKDMAFRSSSKVVLSRSIFPKGMGVASKLIASSLGLIKLSRTRESLYEIFLMGHYGSLNLVYVSNETSNEEFITKFAEIYKAKGLDETTIELEKEYELLTFNSEDHEEIIYTTMSVEIEEMARGAISQSIVETVEDVEWDEEKSSEYSDLEAMKITVGGMANNNILNIGREVYLDFTQHLIDLYLMDSMDSDLLEYVRLKIIASDMKMYQEIYRSSEYDNYPIRMFEDLNSGLCWAYKYLAKVNSQTELSDNEKKELKELKDKIYPIKEETRAKIEKSFKETKKIKYAVIGTLLILFFGYKLIKKYQRESNRKARYEATKPQRDKAVRDLVDHYYPSKPVETKSLEKILKKE